MVKKVFVIHKEVMDVFHGNSYIPTMEKISFHIFCVRIIGSMKCGKTRKRIPW